jgi:hypothetical protein
VWKWARRSSQLPAEELVEECEAFLTGQLGEVLVARDAPKPPWVWLNQLAHGDLAQVESVLHAARPRRRRRGPVRGRDAPSPQVGSPQVGSPQTWPEAIAAVAEELLWFAGGDMRQLRRLQAGLVRLELELAGEGPAIWLTPDALRRKGLDALWTDLADEEKGRVED